MASLCKRTWKTVNGAGSAWVVTFLDVNRKKRSKNFTDKAEAAKYLKLVKVGKAPDAVGKLFTVADVCALYLRVCEQRYRDGDKMEQGTLRQRWTTVDNHILPFIGKARCIDLTPLVIDQFIKDLRHNKAQPRSAQLIRNAIDLLRNALTEAQRLQIINRNILKEVPPRLSPIKKPDIEIPDKAEIKLLLDTSRGVNAIIVELAIFTGLRAGEICALKWENINLEARTIKVKHAITAYATLKGPKSKSGLRTVPFPSCLAEKLTSFRLEQSELGSLPVWQKEWEGFLFFQRRTARPLTSQQLNSKIWQSVCRDAKITNDKGTAKYHFHALRHVAASLFIESGLPPKRIQQLMGHSSINMTFDTYGHLFPDDDAAHRASAGMAAQFGR